MKSFSNKKFFLIVIVSGLVIISGFLINYLLFNDQSIAGTGREINYLNFPQDVSPEVLYSKQIFDSCQYDMHCVVELLTNISREEEKSTGIATFVELISMYNQTQQNFRCHSIAHHLGEWVYGHTQNLEESMQYADPLSCGGGIYHGIFENYFSIHQFEGVDPEQVEIKHLCDDLGERYSLDMAHCLHGLGHGLLILYNYDVFNAVKRCGDFDLNVKRSSCANGIFMQHVLNYYETGEGTFDENELLFPCNKIAPNFASTCYIWQGPYILKQHEFEVYSSFEECDRINPEFIKYCYYGIGMELEVDAGGKMEKALQFCQAGKIDSYHKYCLKGMLMTTSMIYLSNGFSFCTLIPEQFKVDCYEGLGFWISLRHDHDEAREKDCLRAENSQYFEVCMNPKTESISYL